MTFVNFINKLKQYVISRKGNFALMTAVLSPVVIVAGCLAVDIANLTDLKARLQAAMDSVSLSVATRISHGKLTTDQAEEFGRNLLKAQMYDDYSRFTQLVVTPNVKVTPVKDPISGTTSYDVQIYGSASQSTTPFAKFWGKDKMTVNMSSTAVAFIEGQSALSMAIVVDVSSSMQGELSNRRNQVKRLLGLKSNAIVEKIYLKIERVLYGDIHSNYNAVDRDKKNKRYRLTGENMKFILNDYKNTDCNIFNQGANRHKRNIFLLAIGKNPAKVGKRPAKTTERQADKVAYRYCHLLHSAANDIPDEYVRTHGQTSEEIRQAKVNLLAKKLNRIIEAIDNTRITALKKAATSLLTQFDKADPSKKYVRIGLVSYSHQITGNTKMEWGTSAAKRYIANMETDGTTSSTAAVQWAFNQLHSKNPTEKREHATAHSEELKKKKKVFRKQPKRAILFMTDGDNNYPEYDRDTEDFCKAAKKDGIVIYTVAFKAPARGKKLLRKCASAQVESHFFEAKTAKELKAAFADIGRAVSDLGTRLVR